MDRKGFLRTCAVGFCGCMTANIISPASLPAADVALAEDWRFRFVKERYGKLVEILSNRMDENGLKGVITMISPERTDCFSPLNGANTPKVVCNCSLGWQKHTRETLFGRKVKVELKESVLRGGKRCVFQIHVERAAAGAI